ncbi:MAG: ribosome silencing factor [Oligoflexia bacterium]|nr:ribosome silencing factor [Oligoflexia bacterium]
MDLVKAAAGVAWDSKAEDIVVIDVTGRVSYADFVMVCSGQHTRHALAIADRIAAALKQDQGVSPRGVEGKDTGRWVLVDYGDFVVHVFERTQRGYYDIDSLWADAPRLNLEQLGIDAPQVDAGFAPQPFSTTG